MLAETVATSAADVTTAEEVSSQFGLAAMDALLITAALKAKADVFVTSERPTKPIFRVDAIEVVSLAA